MSFPKKNYGHYYGYPECCIQAFHRMFVEKKLFKDLSVERKEAAKYGFVPCQTCAERILKGEVNIQDLILPTRQCEKPFIRV